MCIWMKLYAWKLKLEDELANQFKCRNTEFYAILYLSLS